MKDLLHNTQSSSVFVGSLVVILTLILMSFSALTASAENGNIRSLKNQAKRYYWGTGVEQNYTKALELYERAAELGDVEASFIAGGMYYTGKGTTKDQEKAFKYLNFSASKGKSTPDSQRALAQFYLFGNIVPQNYEKAVEWYTQAAEYGDNDALLELGFLYFVGKGVEQDYEKAYALFEQAALQNSSMAQYNLGIMWYTGNGAPRSDLLKAYAWFSMAAINGFNDAVFARQYVESVMNENEVTTAQAQAAEIYERINRGEATTPK